MANGKNLKTIKQVVAAVDFEYGYIYRLGKDGVLPLKKVGSRLFMDIDDVRAILEKRGTKRHGGKVPDGYITAHEVAHLCGYNVASVNRFAADGEIEALKMGGRNYYKREVATDLRRRRLKMSKQVKQKREKGKKKRPAVFEPETDGVGTNPKSQITIGGEKRTERVQTSLDNPDRRPSPPPQGSSTFNGGWRVARPLAPVPAGSGEKAAS